MIDQDIIGTTLYFKTSVNGILYIGLVHNAELFHTQSHKYANRAKEVHWGPRVINVPCFLKSSNKLIYFSLKSQHRNKNSALAVFC